MKTFKKLFFYLLLCSFLSCSDSEEYIDIADDSTVSETLNLPATSFNYSDIMLPGYFLNNELRAEDNTPNSNPITDAGATLGRVLFYDKKLSANNTVSCASCHVQVNGFSDSNVLSTGFNGGLTGRNSMGLSNAKFYDNGRFFGMREPPLWRSKSYYPFRTP